MRERVRQDVPEYTLEKPDYMAGIRDSPRKGCVSHFPGESSTKRSKNTGSSKSATSYRPFRFWIFRVGESTCPRKPDSFAGTSRNVRDSRDGRADMRTRHPGMPYPVACVRCRFRKRVAIRIQSFKAPSRHRYPGHFASNLYNPSRSRIHSGPEPQDR
uniref:Uncharacterized protein n=1 Tax=Candidatus Kentrum sp. MB TaxID=2138164 RepID=A0A450Y0I1_9GAMM|nr:MAG: hypothetical protein BECKMB1821G_GA0114241_11006 [Candidatus Kentron sp. MB]VFK35031.1 MAG: hypothetical protein BECKMB1821I_GA0114274_10966 [Candidatus Kentron sp. MB]VFK77121.1 MAG: hypothetical protein BECKMB1821H_GA0114242_11016 [Candidatus Kentron sp. MB]